MKSGELCTTPPASVVSTRQSDRLADKTSASGSTIPGPQPMMSTKRIRPLCPPTARPSTAAKRSTTCMKPSSGPGALPSNPIVVARVPTYPPAPSTNSICRVSCVCAVRSRTPTETGPPTPNSRSRSARAARRKKRSAFHAAPHRRTRSQGPRTVFRTRIMHLREVLSSRKRGHEGRSHRWRS